MIRVGTAGSPPAFALSKYKDIASTPTWLREIGLDAYEFQATHGVRTNAERAKVFRDNGEKADIAMSIHAPYYVVLSSESETGDNSIRMMKDAITLADNMGATKVILHPGYYGEESDVALANCDRRLAQIIGETKSSKVFICPETGGKKSAVGSVEDLIRFAKLDKRIRPCIDFGHHHARTGGTLKTAKDFEKVITQIEKELGGDYAQKLHCHFSSLIFTDKGEKAHVPASEAGMGPDYKLFCEAIINLSITPTIICESTSSQDEMALMIKKELARLQK